MSLEADNPEHELTVEELLLMLLHEMRLLNARVEESFETGIESEDIENDDY